MAFNLLELFQAVALRLVLAAIGLGPLFSSRMEVAAPGLSWESIAEAAFLHHTDSPMSPKSSLVSPISLFLTKITGGSLLASVALASAADVASAMALRLLAARGPSSIASIADKIGLIYLWSPLAIVASISGSAAPLYVAAALTAAALATCGHPSLAGTALAAAANISGPQTALLGISIALLAAGGAPKARLRKAVTFIASFAAVAVSLALAQGALLCKSWSAAIGILPQLAMRSVLATVGLEVAFISSKSAPGIWGMEWFSGQSSTSCSRLGSSLATGGDDRWATIEPNLGLQWYLFAEVFPQLRFLFAYCFPAVMAALAVGAALRFARRPLLALCLQAGVLCALGQHLTYADIAFWLVRIALISTQS